MAKEYFEKLTKLIRELDIEAETSLPLEVKHFFSGAALYVDGSIRVSLSPVGLALKLHQNEVEELINAGAAIPLKYFPNGPEKKDYALFESPDLTNLALWKQYFHKSIQKGL